jgi:hypothetical protein
MQLFLSISLALLADIFQLGGNPQLIEQDSIYEKVALTDSTTLEIYRGDSIYVIFTACAPQCSSCVRVYNKEWILIEEVTPIVTSVFPLASFENGRIVWTDNDTWNYQSTL